MIEYLGFFPTVRPKIQDQSSQIECMATQWRHDSVNILAVATLLADCQFKFFKSRNYSAM